VARPDQQQNWGWGHSGKRVDKGVTLRRPPEAEGGRQHGGLDQVHEDLLDVMLNRNWGGAAGAAASPLAPPSAGRRPRRPIASGACVAIAFLHQKARFPRARPPSGTRHGACHQGSR